MLLNILKKFFIQKYSYIFAYRKTTKLSRLTTGKMKTSELKSYKAIVNKVNCIIVKKSEIKGSAIVSLLKRVNFKETSDLFYRPVQETSTMKSIRDFIISNLDKNSDIIECAFMKSIDSIKEDVLNATTFEELVQIDDKLI